MPALDATHTAGPGCFTSGAEGRDLRPLPTHNILGPSMSDAHVLSPHIGLEPVIMAKYGKKAGAEVQEAMQERKRGTLKSRSGKPAIAIGLSKARKAGAKVPSSKNAGR